MNLYLAKFIIFILFVPSLVLAQSTSRVESLLVNADSMTRDLNAQKLFLKGNVQVVYNDQHISCDEAVVDLKNKTIEAVGNLRLLSPTTKAAGTRGVFNYEDETGTLENGFIESGQVSFEAKTIFKTGKNTYETVGGHYTACTTCPPAWEFTGTKIRATLGGYAHITNSVLYLGTVPVFWLPYLIVPLNSKRQTGFLFPTFEYGTDSKVVLSESFFWAIDESQDSTFTFKNYQSRGQKGLINYRYKLTELSEGGLDVAFIRDKRFAGAYQDLNGDSIPTRHMVKYRHYFDLPNNWIQRTQFLHVSDLEYPRDFSKEVYQAPEASNRSPSLTGDKDPALENRFSLSHNGESYHTSVDFTFYRYLVKANPFANNEDVVHRTPAIKYSLLPQKVLNSFLFSLEANYVNFAREDSLFDHKVNSDRGTIPDNQFSPDHDIIRTGQRLDVEPKLSLPFSFGRYADFLTTLSYKEMAYKFGIANYSEAYRRYVRYSLSARTQLSRIYADYNDPTANRFKHEIRPEVIYTNTPWLQQSSEHPFFQNKDIFSDQEEAITNADEPQFDYDDRLYDRHIVTFALSNLLIRKKGSFESAQYNQIAKLRLSSSYDIYEATRQLAPGEVREPWNDISALLDINLTGFQTNSIFRYYPYDQITAISSRARLTNRFGHFLEGQYNQTFQIKKRPFLVSAPDIYDNVSSLENYSESVRTIVGFTTKYLVASGGIEYAIMSRRLTEYFYDFSIIPPGDCWLIGVNYRKPIEGEAIIGMNFGFNYGGGMKSIATQGFDRFR